MMYGQDGILTSFQASIPENPLKSSKSTYKNIGQLIIVFLMMVFLIWIIQEKTKTNLYGYEFYLQWASGRMLAMDNQNPYNSNVPLPDFWEDTASARMVVRRLNTPLYSLVFIFPFMLIDNFDIAFLTWLFFSELLVLTLFLSIIKFTEWKISPLIVIVVAAFLGFSYSSFQAYFSGSLIILTTVFLVFSFLAVKSDKNELAGILLALTTIQAHFYILIYLLAIIWAASVRKWGYIVWFFAGLFILSVISAFIIPGWIMDYFRLLLRFGENFTLWTPADILVTSLPGIGKQLAWALTIGLSMTLVIEWILVRGKEIQWFFWTACLTLTASQLIGLAVDPVEHFILTVPLLLILSGWVRRTGILGQRIMIISLTGIIAVPWFLAYRAGLQPHIITPGNGLFFFMPLILLVGMFWIRWWAIRPLRLYIEELRGNELG
jgi:hypothetical protein